VLGKKNKNLWESFGGIMMNGALGRSLEYSMYTLGRILKAPFQIFKRQSEAFGLTLDVAAGSPLENPLGDLQSSP
jgi:hypothetical protein